MRLAGVAEMGQWVHPGRETQDGNLCDEVQCIMSDGHGGTLPTPADRQTDRRTPMKTLPHWGGNNKLVFPLGNPGSTTTLFKKQNLVTEYLHLKASSD